VKNKTLTLEYIGEISTYQKHIGHRYQVTQITNSVEYRPRQILEEKEVKTLCQNEDWKVIIKKEADI